MFYSSNHPFSITASPALGVAGANLYVWRLGLQVTSSSQGYIETNHRPHSHSHLHTIWSCQLAFGSEGLGLWFMGRRWSSWTEASDSTPAQSRDWIWEFLAAWWQYWLLHHCVPLEVSQLSKYFWFISKIPFFVFKSNCIKCYPSF